MKTNESEKKGLTEAIAGAVKNAAAESEFFNVLAQGLDYLDFGQSAELVFNFQRDRRGRFLINLTNANFDFDGIIMFLYSDGSYEEVIKDDNGIYLKNNDKTYMNEGDYDKYCDEMNEEVK